MGLASDRATCLARLDALAPRNENEARLISIVRAAFEAVPRREQLDDNDVYAMDRDARWVHARFVRGALDASDERTGEPPGGIPPALQALAEEVARRAR